MYHEHVAIATAVLGKPLPKGAHVHHVNNDPKDNRHSNLVICEDAAYHLLLHARQRAYAACGHANWKKCTYCKTYDAPQNLRFAKQGYAYHLACAATYYREAHRRRSSVVTGGPVFPVEPQVPAEAPEPAETAVA